MRKIKFVFLIFIPLFWNSTAFANTNRVDDLAACAGIVIGNSAIDFFMGDEESFDSAANIAYTAYPQRFSPVSMNTVTFRLLTKYLAVM